MTWLKWMYMCILSVCYSFYSRGRQFGFVIPEWGLRQGDPLSPYLFILCAQGLSGMLSKMEREGVIHGCQIARNAQPIFCLFFTDDSYLFFQSNLSECLAIKECLVAYERASGQEINFDKLSISFSSNLDRFYK